MQFNVIFKVENVDALATTTINSIPPPTSVLNGPSHQRIFLFFLTFFCIAQNSPYF
jgi:hypothetical protein